MNLNEIRVTHVRLHSALYLPELGQFTDNLANEPQNKAKDLIMTKVPEGVLVKGKAKTGAVTYLIPNGMIQVVKLAE